MDLKSNAAAAGGETDTFAPATAVPPAGEEPINAREAARVVARHRRRKPDSAEPSSAQGEDPTIVQQAAPAPAPAQELADEANAAQANQIRVAATTACRIKVGDGTPTALATDALLPANQIEYLSCTPGQKIAVIQESAGGKLSVTEIA